MSPGATTVTTGGVVSRTTMVTVSSAVTLNELATLLVMLVAPMGNT
jgi:hypothetical protein